MLSPAAREDPSVCVSTRTTWLVMDDDDWNPIPSCAVSNKNAVVSPTSIARHEDSGDDCCFSKSNLDFDHREEIVKENKGDKKSERPSNKKLVTSKSFRRLKKFVGSNEAVSKKHVVVSPTDGCPEDTDDNCSFNKSKLDFDHREDIVKEENKDKSERPSNKKLVTSKSFRRLKNFVGSNETISNKNVGVSSTYTCPEDPGDDWCCFSIPKLDFDHQDVEEESKDCFGIPKLDFDHKDIEEKESKDKSERPSNRKLVTSKSFRRLKKFVGSNEGKRMKKSKKKLDSLINEEQVVL